jgi:hypothetical protein
MDTEDKVRLERLRHTAGKKGYDIIRSGSGMEPKKGRGYRLVRMFEAPRKPEILVGQPLDGPGATLDEIEAYLEANPPKPSRRST